MSTSGSWNYSVTAANIIQAALEDIGVVISGGSVSTGDSTLCLQRLNFLVKQWQGNSDFSSGLKVWTRQRITLFLAVGQQTYLVGPAATDSRASTAIGRTTISATEAIGQTVLSITSNTDTTTDPGTTITMTSGDIIGIELNDGTIQWTTISGTPASTATVSDALTVASNAGKYVWWFTSRAQRFPEIESAVLRDENRKDVPLAIMRGAASYDQGVADKYADGAPTHILVEPLRLNTRVTLNSQPTDIKKQIILTVLYPAEDYDATSNDIAFPQEYFAGLEWELAFRVHAAFGRPWTTDMELNRKEAVSMAKSLNPETSDAYFQSGT